MAKLFLQRVSETAIQPSQATDYSACFDLYADLHNREITVFDAINEPKVVDTMFIPLVLKPGERALIPTGWKMQPAEGYCIKFYPRSGVAIKKGISLANCVGIIDRDFTHETMLAIQNNSGDTIRFNHEDRLGQLELAKVESIEVELVNQLPELNSNRDGGFGSTGA